MDYRGRWPRALESLEPEHSGCRPQEGTRGPECLVWVSVERWGPGGETLQGHSASLPDCGDKEARLA